MPQGVEEVQTYYAKSAFSDPVMIATFITLCLQLEEVRDLMNMLPDSVFRALTALLAVTTLFLRFFNAQRPVAFIPPTQVKPVEVKSIDATRSK